jgi:uncharacterized protein YyaL (SSP411 family)
MAGLLDLLAVDPDPRWLAAVLERQARLDRDFAAPGGGYFHTPPEVEAPLGRRVPAEEDGLPSPNAVAARNLVRLAALTGDPAYQERARRLAPPPPPHVVIVGPSPRALVDRALYFAPPERMVLVAGEAELAALARLAPALADKTAQGGRATAYVCVETRCGAPATDPQELGAQLALLRLVDSAP